MILSNIYLFLYVIRYQLNAISLVLFIIHFIVCLLISPARLTETRSSFTGSLPPRFLQPSLILSFPPFLRRLLSVFYLRLVYQSARASERVLFILSPSHLPFKSLLITQDPQFSVILLFPTSTIDPFSGISDFH